MRKTFGLCVLVAWLSASCEAVGPAAPDARPPDGPSIDAGEDRAAALGTDVGSGTQADRRLDGAQDTSRAVDMTPKPSDMGTAQADGRSDMDAGAVPVVSFESTCSAEAGAPVSFMRLSDVFGCGGTHDPSTLLVIESSQQLAAATVRFPCLGTPSVQGISFASSRLVVAPVRGEIRWVNRVNDAVVIAVILYGGPAPGSQPFPIAAVLPRSDQTVRGRYCQGGSGCVARCVRHEDRGVGPVAAIALAAAACQGADPVDDMDAALRDAGDGDGAEEVDLPARDGGDPSAEGRPDGLLRDGGGGVDGGLVDPPRFWTAPRGLPPRRWPAPGLSCCRRSIARAPTIVTAWR